LGEKIEAGKGGRVGLGIAWKTLTLDLRKRDEGDVGREGGAESSIGSTTKIFSQGDFRPQKYKESDNCFLHPRFLPTLL